MNFYGKATRVDDATGGRQEEPGDFDFLDESLPRYAEGGPDVHVGAREYSLGDLPDPFGRPDAAERPHDIAGAVIALLHMAHVLEREVRTTAAHATAVALQAEDVEALKDAAGIALNAALQRVSTEGEEHEHAIRERLQAHGEAPHTSALNVFMDSSEKPERAAVLVGSFAQQTFLRTHALIGTYELLERVAEEAGDEATAIVAREHRAADVATAETLRDDWAAFQINYWRKPDDSPGGTGSRPLDSRELDALLEFQREYAVPPAEIAALRRAAEWQGAVGIRRARLSSVADWRTLQEQQNRPRP